MKILIAEDNLIIQMLYRELIHEWGFDYDLAGNGLEVVQFAQKNSAKYELCIMDINMPIMNGFEATKVIRKTVRFFPIIACTNNNEYRDECFKVGMNAFIEKTTFPDELLNIINQFVYPDSY